MIFFGAIFIIATSTIVILFRGVAVGLVGAFTKRFLGRKNKIVYSSMGFVLCSYLAFGILGELYWKVWPIAMHEITNQVGFSHLSFQIISSVILIVTSLSSGIFGYELGKRKGTERDIREPDSRNYFLKTSSK